MVIISVYFMVNYGLLVDPHNTPGLWVRVSRPINVPGNEVEDKSLLYFSHLLGLEKREELQF